MTRLVTLLLSAALFAQQPPRPAETPEEPPEEDASLAPKEYSFNPLQAAKELKIGEFYLKRKSYRAAAARFLEATRWEPSNALAFFRLGEALEALKDAKGARESYAKYLELAPDAKNAAAVRKKLGGKP